MNERIIAATIQKKPISPTDNVIIPPMIYGKIAIWLRHNSNK